MARAGPALIFLISIISIVFAGTIGVPVPNSVRTDRDLLAASPASVTSTLSRSASSTPTHSVSHSSTVTNSKSFSGTRASSMTSTPTISKTSAVSASSSPTPPVSVTISHSKTISLTISHSKTSSATNLHTASPTISMSRSVAPLQVVGSLSSTPSASVTESLPNASPSTIAFASVSPSAVSCVCSCSHLACCTVAPLPSCGTTSGSSGALSTGTVVAIAVPLSCAGVCMMLCVGAMCWRRRRSSTKKRTRFDSPSGHNERHGQSDSDDKVNAERELDGSVVSIPTCDDHSIVDGNSVGSNTHHHPEKLNVSCCRCIRFKWRGTTTQRTQRKKKHRSSSRSRRSRRHTDDAEGDKHGSAIEPQQAVDTVDVYQPRYASLDPPDGSWDDIPDPSDSAMSGQSPPQHLFQYDTGAGDEAYWRAVSRASPQQPIRFDVPQHRAWQTGRHTAVTPQPLHNSNQWPARPSSAQGQLQGQANGFRRVTVDEMKRMIAARPVRMKALAPQLAPQPPQMSSVMTAPIVVRSQGDGDQPGQLFHLVPVQPASSHSHHSHMMPPGPVSITGDREYSEDTLIDTIPSPTFPDDGSTAMTVREYQVRSPAIARSILSGTPILARGKRRTIRRLTRNGRNSRARSRIASVATAEASRVMMDEDPGVGEAHLGGLFPDSMDQIERDVMVAKSAIRLFKKKLRAKRRMRYATSAPALTLPGYGGSP